MTHNRGPTFIGANREAPLFAPCGLCGITQSLSRTHIPPQAAGNTNPRYREQIKDKVRRPGSFRDGGLWVRGLCSSCNSDAGGTCDTAYVAFANEMRPFVHNGQLYVPSRRDVPAKAVAPGLVARSVMFNMFALWLRLREFAPELAAGLHAQEHPLRLPPQYRLRVAAYRGRPVVESLTFAAHVMRMTDAPYNVVGAFYFEPFAWALTHEDDVLLDRLGWGDATDWIRYNPDATRLDLRNVLDRFPLTDRPADMFGDSAMEMSSDEHVLMRGR